MKLLRERDMTAGEIAEHFQLTKPTLSKHFGVLREAGLIEDVKSGRYVTYHLNASVLENALLSLIEEYECVWTPPGDIESVAHEIVEIVTCEFARSKMDIKTTFSRSGEISGLWLLKTE